LGKVNELASNSELKHHIGLGIITKHGIGVNFVIKVEAHGER